MSDSVYRRAYYLKHKERILAQGKARYRANPEAHKARTRSWAARHPERVKVYNDRGVAKQRVRRYGVSPEAFNAALQGQGGRCAVCRTDAPGRRGWHQDHDHDTTKARGVLCQRCNRALGMLRDDPHIVMAAATYLLTHKAKGRVG